MAPRSASRRAAAALALALSIATPLAATAQVDAYKQHMENGVKLYADHNYPAALVEFRAAYDAKPSANPLLDIALCDKEMFRYPQAIQALKDALARHGATMAPSDKKGAEDAIKEMEAILGTVTLTVTPHGATVLVDGDELRSGAADQPIKLGPGAHKIVARADGYKGEERSVLISSGLDAKVAITLVPEEPAPPPQRPVEPPPPQPPPVVPKKPDGPPPTRGVYILGLGAVLFPTTHATGWPQTRTDYGAGYGLRVGFQVNEVAGFDAMYEHSSIDTLSDADPTAYYRIVANRVALGLRLISPGTHVRFVGGFGGGFVGDSIVFIFTPSKFCGKNVMPPTQACPFASGSGYDAFAMVEAGLELDIDRVLIDFSGQGEFQSTGNLSTDSGSFSIFGAHPLVNIGPALRFGYRFW